MVTVFQCGVAGLVAVRWYAMPLDFHSEMHRSYIALFGVGVLLVNVVLVCAEEWLLSPRGQISGAAE